MRSVERQTARLEERRQATTQTIRVHEYKLEIDPCVYRTGLDTQLFIDSIEISPSQDFLEIGCGSGAISIGLACKARFGLACDINPAAVENTQRNLTRLGLHNVRVICSDVFSHVNRQFDVIVFNCPYSNHPAQDSVDRMFWDPDDRSKKTFFKDAGKFLNNNGYVYFGWADFEGLDPLLPDTLAREAGFHLENTFARRVPDHGFSYYVLKYSLPTSA